MHVVCCTEERIHFISLQYSSQVWLALVSLKLLPLLRDEASHQATISNTPNGES